MAETLTRTWFDQMAGAVAELEMLRTVVAGSCGVQLHKGQ
jgi:hypothetical protein